MERISSAPFVRVPHREVGCSCVPNPGLPGPEVKATWSEPALPPTGASWYVPAQSKPAAPFPSCREWHPQLLFLPAQPLALPPRHPGLEGSPPATCSSTGMAVGRVCGCPSTTGLSLVQKGQVQGAFSTLCEVSLELLPCGAPSWAQAETLRGKAVMEKGPCLLLSLLRQMGVLAFTVG